MKGTIIFFMCVCALFAHALPIAWINEIHYENIGTDKNEFVEVVVLNPEDYYLDDLALYLVNGYNGVCYSLDTVQEFELGERVGNYQFYIWYKRGLQNDTEGMHLVFRDTTLDIIAYEGSFTGCSEPSTGLVFPDICVCENNASPDTCSVYRCAGRDSEWMFGVATPGSCNVGQNFNERSSKLILNEFKIKLIDTDPLIIWSCSQEDDICKYKLYKNRHLIYEVEKSFNNDQNTYHYHDHAKFKINNSEYILSQLHLNGNETFLDTLICSLPTHRDIGLGIPFPNPFNPIISLPYTLENTGDIDISVNDLFGKQVYHIHKHIHAKGAYLHQIDMSDFASGEYILQFKKDQKVISHKISLIK